MKRSDQLLAVLEMAKALWKQGFICGPATCPADVMESLDAITKMHAGMVEDENHPIPESDPWQGDAVILTNMTWGRVADTRGWYGKDNSWLEVIIERPDGPTVQRSVERSDIVCVLRCVPIPKVIKYHASEKRADSVVG